MPIRITWALFLGTAILLVILVVGLNCLQSTAALKLFGVLECNYGLTSSDIRIKAGGTMIFVLFLVLIFGPIAAAIGRPRFVGRSKSSN